MKLKEDRNQRNNDCSPTIIFTIADLIVVGGAFLRPRNVIALAGLYISS